MQIELKKVRFGVEWLIGPMQTIQSTVPSQRNLVRRITSYRPKLRVMVPRVPKDEVRCSLSSSFSSYSSSSAQQNPPAVNRFHAGDIIVVENPVFTDHEFPLVARAEEKEWQEEESS